VVTFCSLVINLKALTVNIGLIGGTFNGAADGQVKKRYVFHNGIMKHYLDRTEADLKYTAEGRI
jgi:hypothetical protein